MKGDSIIGLRTLELVEQGQTDLIAMRASGRSRGLVQDPAIVDRTLADLICRSVPPRVPPVQLQITIADQTPSRELHPQLTATSSLAVAFLGSSLRRDKPKRPDLQSTRLLHRLIVACSQVRQSNTGNKFQVASYGVFE
jgi:hypothetical protein